MTARASLTFRDPIVDEVREIKERLAEKFDYDVKAMLADAQRKDARAGRKVVASPGKGAVTGRSKRRREPAAACNAALRLRRATRQPRQQLGQASVLGHAPLARVSRSRIVTVPSASVWLSTVMQNGVPTSSWRR